jgi:hypothetical protein
MGITLCSVELGQISRQAKRLKVGEGFDAFINHIEL